MLRSFPMLVLFAWAAAAANTSTPLTSSEQANDADRVVTKAWVDEDRIAPSTTVRLWVAIENNSPWDLEGVAFDEFQTPGFNRAGSCWAGPTPSCHDDGKGQPYARLPTVSAGNRLVVWAPVTRDDSLSDGGKVVITGLLHWTPKKKQAQAVNSAVSSSVLELLPTTFYTSPFNVWIREIAKDLVIPVTALIGTLALSFLLHKRGERQVILTEMLEKVTRDAERHLLPTSAAATGMIIAAERFHTAYAAAPAAKKSDVWPAHQDEVLFALIAFRKQTRYMKDTIGGFYLKLRSAEAVSANAINVFVDCLEQRLGAKNEVARVVTAVIPSVTSGSFEKRVADAKLSGASDAEKAFVADVDAIGTKLGTWLATPSFMDQEILALRILTTVLDVEIDRGFQRWYEERPHVNRWLLRRHSAQCKSICAALELSRDPSHEAFKDLQATLLDYRRETAGIHGWIWRPAFRTKRWMSELRGRSGG